MSIKTLFENIADAIRETSGSIDTYTPAEMPDAIRNFNSIFQTKNLSTTIEGQTTVEGCLSALSEKTDLTYNTVSGNPVSFTADSAGISRNTIVTLEPIQSGSGDPSPSNPRPIVGYDAITVDVNSTNVISINTPSTIYGGAYDVETGELTVNYAIEDFANMSWIYSSTGAYFYSHKLLNVYAGQNIVCSNYKYVGQKTQSEMASVPTGSIASASVGEVKVKNTDYTDAATFQTAMSGVKLAYELATPYTIQLEPHLLPLLSGANTVSTNGTSIAVTYRNGLVARVDDLSAVADAINTIVTILENSNNT